jgi:hypothetical protein
MINKEHTLHWDQKSQLDAQQLLGKDTNRANKKLSTIIEHPWTPPFGRAVGTDLRGAFHISQRPKDQWTSVTYISDLVLGANGNSIHLASDGPIFADTVAAPHTQGSAEKTIIPT